MTIVEFIEARLAEDESDTAPQRAILEQAEGVSQKERQAWLRKLAAEYSDHPDYDPAWKPEA